MYLQRTKVGSHFLLQCDEFAVGEKLKPSIKNITEVGQYVKQSKGESNMIPQKTARIAKYSFDLGERCERDIHYAGH